MSKLKLLRITTVPISLHLLLKGQFRFMVENGYEVYTASAEGKEVGEVVKEGVTHIVIPFTRKITPVKDLICLWQLIQLIRRLKPEIVHTHTPKAGLLGMIAAKICGVPVRVHTIAGLPLMEEHGAKRKVLEATERITYACAHRVYPNSTGLQEFVRQHLKIDASKLKIIGKGSSNGIDTSFFTRTPELEAMAKHIRTSYQISDEDIVFGFVGRIVRDKGIGEFVQAFKKMLGDHAPDKGRLFMLLIGPFENDLDPLDKADMKFLQENAQVILPGFQSDVRPWIMASDIFIFPSYREGFPNVVMQACCLGVPCVVTNINGSNEIIQHGQTGLIVAPKNAEALCEAMAALTNDRKLRLVLGAQARAFVVSNFDQQYVWAALLQEYRLLVKRQQ